MLCAVSSARAQQPASSAIRGQVLDAQHRGVTAHIEAVQPRIGLRRATESDAAGHFALSNIPPEALDLIVTASGFTERRMTGIQLEVGRTAEIEIDLQIEGVTEKVTVAGKAGAVDVLSSVVGSVVSAREIESLPLNGRNFLELALLTPGNTRAPNFDPTKAQSVVVSSAGQAGRGGNVMIDGMDDNDDVVGGPLQNISQDSVQEFQVATNRFAAELGRSAGSVINVVTKSGGDAMHGSGACLLRDRRLQSIQRPSIRAGQASRRSIGNRPRSPSADHSGRRLFWFGSLEVRNQNGGVLVGTRNNAAQTSFARLHRRRSTTFSAHCVWIGVLGRVRTSPSGIRPAGRRCSHERTGPGDRYGVATPAIAKSTARRSRIMDERVVAARRECLQRKFQRFRQQHFAGRAWRSADVPELAGRFVLPCAARHETNSLAVLRRPIAAAWRPSMEIRQPGATCGREI